MIYPYIREEDVLRIYEKIKEIKPEDADKVFKKISNIDYVNDKFVAISRENDDIFGFMFATIEEFDNELVSFIQFCFSTKAKEGQIMLNSLEEWSRNRDIKTIIFLSQRDEKAWKRKYNFDQVYKVFKRRIQ